MLDPIFIPTYKNRKNNIVQRLASGEFKTDPKRNVFFVCYDFDFKESGYDKIELKAPNCHFHLINFEEFLKTPGYERCIQSKRNYIQKFAEKAGFKRIWMFDDDLRSVWKTEEYAHDGEVAKRVECEFEEALQFVEKTMEGRDFSVAGVPETRGSLESAWAGKSYEKADVTILDNHYVNIEALKEKNVYFKTGKFKSEDLGIVIDGCLAGLHTYKLIGDYSFDFEPVGKSTSLTESYRTLSYELWKDYGRILRFKPSTKVANKDKKTYVNCGIDKKRLYANMRVIDDYAQKEMEKATNEAEWTDTVFRLAKELGINRKGF